MNTVTEEMKHKAREKGFSSIFKFGIRKTQEQEVGFFFPFI